MGKYKGGVYHVDDQVRLEPHRKDVNALLSDALGRKVTLPVSYDEDRERAHDRDDLNELADAEQTVSATLKENLPRP